MLPQSTLGNWAREFNRWCPNIKVLKLGGEKEERQRLAREELLSGEYEVVVTSYETLCIEKTAFRKLAYYYVIIDEVGAVD